MNYYMIRLFLARDERLRSALLDRFEPSVPNQIILQGGTVYGTVEKKNRFSHAILYSTAKDALEQLLQELGISYKDTDLIQREKAPESPYGIHTDGLPAVKLYPKPAAAPRRPSRKLQTQADQPLEPRLESARIILSFLVMLGGRYEVVVNLSRQRLFNALKKREPSITIEEAEEYACAAFRVLKDYWREMSGGARVISNKTSRGRFMAFLALLKISLHVIHFRDAVERIIALDGSADPLDLSVFVRQSNGAKRGP